MHNIGSPTKARAAYITSFSREEYSEEGVIPIY